MEVPVNLGQINEDFHVLMLIISDNEVLFGDWNESFSVFHLHFHTNWFLSRYIKIFLLIYLFIYRPGIFYCLLQANLHLIEVFQPLTSLVSYLLWLVELYRSLYSIYCPYKLFDTKNCDCFVDSPVFSQPRAYKPAHSVGEEFLGRQVLFLCLFRYNCSCYSVERCGIWILMW